MIKLKIISLLIFITFLSAQDGIITYKYPNGTKSAELSYINDILDGTSYYYFNNGFIKEIANYSEGVLHGKQSKFFESGLLKVEEYIKNGKRDGLKKIYYDNGALSKVIYFEDGIRKKVVTFDYDTSYQAPASAYKAGQQKNKKTEDFFCSVEICPEPVGGMYSVYQKLEYPEDAKIYGLEGTVILIASVDKEGNVTSTKIARSLGLGCDEAASEAVKNTNFIPGQNNDNFVTADVTLSIKFKLDKETKQKYHIAKKTISKTPEKIKETISEIIENTKPSVPSTKIECNADICPEPLNGYKSIYNNLDVPLMAKRMEVNDYVIVEAEIDEFGFVRNTRVLKSIGYGCDEEAELAILGTQFIPAKTNGKEINSIAKIIIEFNTKEKSGK